MEALFTRADREIAVEDFGPSRVREGIITLHRRSGLRMLTDEALDALLQMLVSDARFSERLNAENRARRASDVRAA